MLHFIYTFNLYRLYLYIFFLLEVNASFFPYIITFEIHLSSLNFTIRRRMMIFVAMVLSNNKRCLIMIYKYKYYNVRVQ